MAPWVHPRWLHHSEHLFAHNANQIGFKGNDNTEYKRKLESPKLERVPISQFIYIGVQKRDFVGAVIGGIFLPLFFDSSLSFTLFIGR